VDIEAEIERCRALSIDPQTREPAVPPW
jgi:hypothetical protein